MCPVPSAVLITVFICFVGSLSFRIISEELLPNTVVLHPESSNPTILMPKISTSTCGRSSSSILITRASTIGGGTKRIFIFVFIGARELFANFFDPLCRKSSPNRFPGNGRSLKLSPQTFHTRSKIPLASLDRNF